jgi:hypothetical protein
MRVATDYANLLKPGFDGVEKLVTSYPSHGFVIDREQAELIFKNVRSPIGEESAFHSFFARTRVFTTNFIGHLKPPAPAADEKANEPATNGTDSHDAPNGTTTGDTEAASVEHSN